VKTRKYTNEQFANAIAESFSWANVMRLLNLKGGGAQSNLRVLAERLKLNTSHFTGSGWNVGLKFHPNPSQSLNVLLVSDSTYTSTARLKERLFKANLKRRKCEWCGLKNWRKLPAPLELDHINGKRQDNRLENLRILCANCHAQTDTYRGKNIGKSGRAGNRQTDAA
jgi:5-methylcytosine-specific restriction endonuclease McrA